MFLHFTSINIKIEHFYPTPHTLGDAIRLSIKNRRVNNLASVPLLPDTLNKSKPLLRIAVA